MRLFATALLLSAACCSVVTGVSKHRSESAATLSAASSAAPTSRQEVLGRVSLATFELDRELDLIADHVASTEDTPMKVITKSHYAERFEHQTPNLDGLAQRFMRAGAHAESQATVSTKAKTKFFGWSTHSKYKFPYWSSSSRKYGEPLNEGTGGCFIGIFPWVKMKRNDLMQSVGGVFKQAIGATECKSNDQCDVASTTWACMGQVSVGMSLRPVCYKAPGENACACGIVLDHILFKEYCAPGKQKVDKNIYPPKYALTVKQLLGVDKERDERIAMLKPVIHEKVSEGGVLSHMTSGIGDFFSDYQRLPVWADESDKKEKGNGKYCIVGILPYVKCGRMASSAVKDFITGNGFTCETDDSCYCKGGCAGPLIPGPDFAQFKPVCYKQGFNACVCALVSTTPETPDECAYPTMHKDKMPDGGTFPVYYGGKGCSAGGEC